MSITTFQIHNVLRTYDHLIKSKPVATAQPQKKTGDKTSEVSVPADPVTISEQSRKRLNQDEPLNHSEGQ